MSKKKDKARDSSTNSLTRAEIEAAKRANFPLGGIIGARVRIKEIAASHEKRVQYWALTDDLCWTPEQAHERLFLVVRLLLEYAGAPDRHISDRRERMNVLANLATRLTADLPDEMPEGPTLLALDRLSQPSASAN